MNAKLSDEKAIVSIINQDKDKIHRHGTLQPTEDDISESKAIIRYENNIMEVQTKWIKIEPIFHFGFCNQKKKSQEGNFCQPSHSKTDAMEDGLTRPTPTIFKVRIQGIFSNISIIYLKEEKLEKQWR